MKNDAPIAQQYACLLEVYNMRLLISNGPTGKDLKNERVHPQLILQELEIRVDLIGPG